MHNHRYRFGLGVLCSVIALALALPATYAPAQQDTPDRQNDPSQQEQKVRDLYQKGGELLKNKKIDQAYTRFQRAIETARELDPQVRGSLLRWLWHSSSTRLFDQMLQDPKLKHAAERIMELAKGAYWTWKMDESRISRLVENLVADDYKTRMDSQRQLISAGQYAAPSLIEELKADSSEMRSMAIQTLQSMDSRVVLPVVEALESNSEVQRKNAAIVLGLLGDPRALPALKRTYEQDESDLVRAEAREAIRKILKARLPSYLRTRARKMKDATVAEVLKKTGSDEVPLHRSHGETQDHTHEIDPEKAELRTQPKQQKPGAETEEKTEEEKSAAEQDTEETPGEESAGADQEATGNPPTRTGVTAVNRIGTGI